MDTLPNRLVIPLVLVVTGTMLVASAPFTAEADESILSRVVDVVSPRRTGGPVARLHRRIEERPSHRNDYQDGLVVHAGGAYAGQFDSLEGHGENTAGVCRGGHCDDHCVVRPDRFGYYETQWRQWPGARVVQAAGLEELTPASPPRLQPPEENEESLDPDAPVEFGVDEPVEDSDATTLPGLGPVAPPRTAAPSPRAVPPARTPPPESRQTQQSGRAPGEPGQKEKSGQDDEESSPESGGKEPAKPATEPESDAESKPEAKQPAGPKPPSTDDNLFDEAGHRRRLQERLAVVRSEAFLASVAEEPRAAEARAEPGMEEPSMFQANLAVDSEKVDSERLLPAARGVRPVVYDRSPSPADPNPLRSSGERGWRARLVDENRSAD